MSQTMPGQHQDDHHRPLKPTSTHHPGNSSTPSIWTAYRTAHPTGISAATWLLILGELFCWLLFGLYKPDPRLIALGATGVVASLIMLARIYVVPDRYFLRWDDA